MTPSRSLRWIGLAALAALVLIALAVAAQQWRLHERVEEGRRLVQGEAYLPAARALLRAVAAAPDDGQAHYYLGLAYAGMGRTGAAVSEIEDAVRLQPAEIRYRVGLAGLLLDQGRLAEARAELERVTRSRPGAADVRLLLARSPPPVRRPRCNGARISRGDSAGRRQRPGGAGASRASGGHRGGSALTTTNTGGTPE